MGWKFDSPASTAQPRKCSIWAVGIAQDNTVVVCQVNTVGFMADSGTNACMADSEADLVDCHDIPPVTVGLVLASDGAPVMHICNRMGYRIVAQEDGSVHQQLFLVNAQATDCIMSPDTIMQQTPDCVS